MASTALSQKAISMSGDQRTNVVGATPSTPSQALSLDTISTSVRLAPHIIVPESPPALRINPEYTEKMSPADASSLNELLDRIRALRLSSSYDHIGLIPDDREIHTPPVTHLIAKAKDQLCPGFRAPGPDLAPGVLRSHGRRPQTEPEPQSRRQVWYAIPSQQS